MLSTRRLATTLAVSLFLASIAAAVAAAGADVGPGPATATLTRLPYRLELRLSPNKAAVAGTISIRLTRDGRPVDHARIRATFTMLDMDMGSVTKRVPHAGPPGLYARPAPVLGMGGHWRVRIHVTPAGGAAFTVSVVDDVGA